ncbi:VWA domain-containing protein [Halovenus sp. WSH3]|uniref:VWA domain-containing protein n=1 Tax=Halovenus carboxidivorans TaxID=2692199 RepID=A0A6B0T7A4_9EURY|nr:VWA domain-containing protein [Halovenus carboxidivorans]MXR52827.1 VWA domain-containing protein [Halovenus carboxidivorans]
MTDDVPDLTAAREHVLQSVVRFARRLRAEGAIVPADAALTAVEALAEVGLRDRAAVRAAMHAALVTNPRDSAVFDEQFDTFWYRLRTGLEGTAAHDETGDRAENVPGDDRTPSTDTEGQLPDTSIAETLDGSGDLADEEGTIESRRVADSEGAALEGDPGDERAGTYSAVGDRTSVEEDAVTTTVDDGTMRRVEAALATLAGRRWDRTRSGETVDVRRALRESMATGGVTMSLPDRDRAESAFRVCVLVDVSRSVLDAVDREFLLSVLDALVDRARSTRVFFFDTEIREVTDAFAGGDPAAALERAEVDWGGGTRIGASLSTLRRRWPTAVDRRTVSLVISDGLEVGEIDELERGVSWLSRRSKAFVWLNPLAASPSWEPTCRGMAAVEPYLDGLFAFGGPADLDDAARQLARHGPGGPVGYEHDFRDRTEAGDGGVSP